MKYQLAIFDMDGTILDTLEDLTDTMNYALKKHGYPLHTIDRIRTFVGNGIPKLIERAVPEGTDAETVAFVHHDFMEYYKVHCADKTRAYDGIPELIGQLRQAGCKTAVVSNKADTAVHTLCQQYFPGCFDVELGDREGQKKKPAPDAVYEVLRRLGIPKEEAVYIGDSEVDLATAKNAEMDCIAVSWGFRDVEFLKKQGAQLVVSSTGEIAQRILED
jgi:phosphoglycolate phosphatase